MSPVILTVNSIDAPTVDRGDTKIVPAQKQINVKLHNFCLSHRNIFDLASVDLHEKITYGFKTLVNK